MTGNREEMQNRVDTSMKVAAHRKVGDTGKKGTFFFSCKDIWRKKKTQKMPAQFIDPRYTNEQTWYSLFIYPLQSTKIIFCI